MPPDIHDATLFDIHSRFAAAAHKCRVPFLRQLVLQSRFAHVPFNSINELLPRTGLIVEFGCGHGILSQAVKQFFPNRTVFGSDLSLDRLKVAAELSVAQHSPMPLFVASAQETPLKKKCIDAALIAEMLYLLPFAEQAPAVLKILRSIKPGGVLVCCEPVKNFSPGSIIQRMVSTLLMFLSGMPGGKNLFGHRSPGAPFLHTSASLVELFLQNGCIVDHHRLLSHTWFPQVLIAARTN